MIDKPELTNPQRNVLNWIIWFKQIHGYPPSRREIADEFRYKSETAASDVVHALQKKGRLIIIPRIARGIVILEQD